MLTFGISAGSNGCANGYTFGGSGSARELNGDSDSLRAHSFATHARLSLGRLRYGSAGVATIAIPASGTKTRRLNETTTSNQVWS